MSKQNPLILVIDDFQTTRDIIKNTLIKKGYKVIEAINGNDALKHFDGSEIDLVITDFNMPELDGVGLIQKIRNDDRYKYIPILVLSTETNSDKKEKAMSAGATGWIVKPFEIAPFLKIVEKVVHV